MRRIFRLSFDCERRIFVERLKYIAEMCKKSSKRRRKAEKSQSKAFRRIQIDI